MATLPRVLPEAAPTLWDPATTAEYLGVTTQRLAVWRMDKRGPAFVRVGRLIRYPLPEVLAYVEANTVPSGGSR